MAYNTQFIFPTSVYGQISDVYGTNVTQYANSGGLPQGSGLVLGQLGLLFDDTVCRLFKANSSIAQYAGVTPVLGNGNDYTVTTTINPLAPITAVNDRGGSTALSVGGIAWMTTRGNATALVAASITSGQGLSSSTTTPGLLVAYAPASNYYNSPYLLNTSTTQGGYPVLFL